MNIDLAAVVFFTALYCFYDLLEDEEEKEDE